MISVVLYFGASDQFTPVVEYSTALLLQIDFLQYFDLLADFQCENGGKLQIIFFFLCKAAYEDLPPLKHVVILSPIDQLNCKSLPFMC